MSTHSRRAAIFLAAVLLVAFVLTGGTQQTPALRLQSSSFQNPGHPSPAQSAKAPDSSSQGGRTVAFVLKTTAFPLGGSIPKKYTCDGGDLSPALSWSNPPEGTQSFTLIADDPDAPVGTWTHWIIWNIPATATTLPEGMAKAQESADGTRQGTNDFKRIGYGGPCPPPGKPHRYFFKLYALGAKLEVKPGGSRQELERAMKGRMLSQVEIMGRYGR
jgi:hypothetical protein